MSGKRNSCPAEFSQTKSGFFSQEVLVVLRKREFNEAFDQYHIAHLRIQQSF